MPQEGAAVFDERIVLGLPSLAGCTLRAALDKALELGFEPIGDEAQSSAASLVPEVRTVQTTNGHVHRRGGPRLLNVTTGRRGCDRGASSQNPLGHSVE